MQHLFLKLLKCIILELYTYEYVTTWPLPVAMSSSPERREIQIYGMFTA